MTAIVPSYHLNPNQRTPCMLVLDISNSMNTRAGKGTRIGELNQGLKVLEQALREDEAAIYRVQIAIVTVGGPRDEAVLMLDWTDACDLEVPTLEAAGTTPLGQGMQLALHHIERQKQTLRNNGVPYTRPWVMVISDGEPTDAPQLWSAAALDCREAEKRKRCVIYPIGVDGADLKKLQQLSATPAKMLRAANFSEYFQWLSASLSVVSNSSEKDSLVLPATDPWSVVQR